MNIFLKPFLFLCLTLSVQVSAQTVVNGIPWYDQNREPVSAHGANIIKDGGRYYLFGEYKTDSANVFTGFSCYSSSDLAQWQFEGMAFSQQQDGRMGPERVGERPKVLRCPKTGEYVMLMHTDNLQYKDPCTCYATSKNVTGPYEFQGPILYKGQPVRKWDIGSFMDDDGRGYLLVHHGMIYRLADDFHSLDSCLMSGVKGSGESPAMMKKDGTYYWMSSHTTSWERNDNMYWTATSLGGPWTYGGEFCPKGSLTWNSQCSFLLPLDDGRWMYMGDRWSFPRQRQAATYVWLPIEARDGTLSIPEYWEQWNPLAGKQTANTGKTTGKRWQSVRVGDTFIYKYNGTQIGLYGNTDNESGYADISIKDKAGNVVFQTSIDFYSLKPAKGLRWLSPHLPKGKYTLEVTVSEMKPNWTDKSKTLYGSKGHKVEITDVLVNQTELFPDGTTPVSAWFNDTLKVDVNTLGRQYLLTDYGVAQDSAMLQTKQIQSVIDRCAHEGGGVVVVPQGTFLTGALFFKRGTHLHFQDGGRLKGIDDIRHYPLVPMHMEGQQLNYFAALVNADGVDGFTITGHGTIDGNAQRFWDEFWIRRQWNQQCTNMEALRPQLVYISHSSNVTVQDVRLINSAFWTNHLYRCHHVKYIDCYIVSPTEGKTHAPSSDGIDLDDCDDVLVHGCYISVWDDGVCLKGGKGTWVERDPSAGPVNRVIVEKCTFGPEVIGGITFGSEAYDCHNVILRDCHFQNSWHMLLFKMRTDTPQKYGDVLMERCTGTAHVAIEASSWSQFHALSDRPDMPVSTVNNVIIRDLQGIKVGRFFNVNHRHPFKLSNFTLQDINVTDRQNVCHTKEIENVYFKNVVLNGKSLE